MPHRVIATGSQTSTQDALASSTMIPGVEPGGSTAGKPNKPALLLKDVFLEVVTLDLTGTGGFNNARIFLKLSQDSDLVPGLILPIGQFSGEWVTATAVGQNLEGGLGGVYHHLFHAQGTVWAPAYVGLRVLIGGTLTVDVKAHIDYEVIEVPWMDWFIMWDFLDNVVNNDDEY